MPYVRARGSQVLIVHGERVPQTGKVEQRVLFTFYSQAEAREAMAQAAPPQAGRFTRLLERECPDVRFDWKRIRKALGELLPVLPEEYDYGEERVRARFREALRVFTRQLALVDPQDLFTSAEIIRENRRELEWLADTIQWRVQLCEQKETEWNRDDRFHWRFSLRGRDVPVETEEMAAALWEKGDLDQARSVFQLLVECFPGYADGHNYLGLVALERENLDEAIRQFTSTIEAGRRLFAKRIRRAHWWRDHQTRPYMRGLRNLAIALNRAGRYDEALATCDRLENECDDRIGAMALRGPVYLNTGRWAEAAGAGVYLQQVHPEESLTAALGHYEAGRHFESVACLLHAALNAPRTTRLVLGLRTLAPRSGLDARDHNGGIGMIRDLHAYRPPRMRTTLRSLARLLESPGVAALVTEQGEVSRRWSEDRKGADRAAFVRMTDMQKLEFAREQARELAPGLGLRLEPEAIAPRQRARKPARGAAPVH